MTNCGSPRDNPTQYDKISSDAIQDPTIIYLLTTHFQTLVSQIRATVESKVFLSDSLGISTVRNSMSSISSLSTLCPLRCKTQ